MTIIVNGLVSGGVYALLAIGFSLIFGVAKIANLAHTTFYMVGAYLLFFATVTYGLPLVPSFIVVIAIVVLLGMLSYKLLFDRLKQHETSTMLVAIALALLIQEILTVTIGTSFHRVAPFVSGFAEIAGFKILYQQIFALGTSLIALVAVLLLLSKTRLGVAIRAVSQDREAANLMGIDVSRICLIVMGISALLAGIAGGVVSPLYTLSPTMWMSFFVVMIVAVVLGGLGSIKGSVIAAFALAFIETIVVFVIPGGSYLKGVVPLALLVGILMVRPEGLFGVAFEEERL